MPRHRLHFQALVLSVLLALPAAAQEGIRWQQDIEGAKTLARQSGRLVLIHFWTPECGPCKTLDQNVFNQPGVAGAVETRFVPVKLNANENSAIAEGFGITRVPTDILLTADGRVIGKIISPPTPAGYVAEVTKVAAQYQYSGQSGSAFDAAAAAAPSPSLLNSAYAGLQVPVATPPAIPVGQQGPAGERIASTVPSVSSNKTSAPSTTPPPLAPPLATPNYTPVAQPSAAKPPTTGAAPVPTAPAITAPSIYASVNNNATDRYSAVSLPADTPPTVPAPQTTANLYVNPPALNTSTTAPATSPQPIMGPPSLNPALPTPLSNPYVPASPAAITQPAAPPLPSMLDRPASAAPTTTPAGTPVMPPAPPQPNLSDSNGVKAAPPDPSRLPPGAPPLGFDGYCPVNMRNHWKWVAGNPQYGAIHRGRTYWFAAPADQEAFLKNPDFYTPALSGFDPVLAIDHKQQVPGRREHSLDYDNMFYLFASEATLQQFTANPEKYATSVRQAMGINRGRLVR